jgi:hypothetical protein
LEDEKENLIKIAELEKKYINTLEGAMELVNQLVDPQSENILLLEDAERVSRFFSNCA